MFSKQNKTQIQMFLIWLWEWTSQKLSQNIYHANVNINLVVVNVTRIDNGIMWLLYSAYTVWVVIILLFVVTIIYYHYPKWTSQKYSQNKCHASVNVNLMVANVTQIKNGIMWLLYAAYTVLLVIILLFVITIIYYHYPKWGSQKHSQNICHTSVNEILVVANVTQIKNGIM